MEYNVRYGLEFDPFIKNSKDIICGYKDFEEATVRLNYLTHINGFGVLTGNPGKGKSTVVRKWATSLNPALYKVIYTSLSTLTDIEFYRDIASLLGLEPAHTKCRNVRMIKNEIERLYGDNRKTPVFIIDEANHIKSSILEDMKILFNFDMDSKDKSIVILIGLPNLNHSLNLTAHEAIKQRIVMNFNMEGLTKDEAKSYIISKLNGAGCHNPIFEAPAIEAIANASDGTPRIINKICSASLNFGNLLEANIITADIVMRAIEDLSLG